MARKKVPSIVRTVKRVTITLDVVVTNEDDLRYADQWINGGIEGGIYETTPCTVDNVKVKSILAQDVVKISEAA